MSGTEYIYFLLDKSSYEEDFKCYAKDNIRMLFSKKYLDENNIENNKIFLFDEIKSVYLDFKKNTKSFGNFKTYKAKNTTENDLFDSYEASYSNSNVKTEIQYVLTIEKEEQIVEAIKDILWYLGNVPSTSKKILNHINILDHDGFPRNISSEDYIWTNKYFKIALNNKDLNLGKINDKDKSIWLYSNPTNKRTGYFYKGKLLTLSELSNMHGVDRKTIFKRLKKMSIEKAILPK
jgi:hypothetical protein